MCVYSIKHSNTVSNPISPPTMKTLTKALQVFYLLLHNVTHSTAIETWQVKLQRLFLC